MNIYNIRIINNASNEYKGCIIINSDGAFFGKSTELKDDKEFILQGNIYNKVMEINITLDKYDIYVIAERSNIFPKKSIGSCVYFSGCSLDSRNDKIYIEITNIQKLEKQLLEEFFELQNNKESKLTESKDITNINFLEKHSNLLPDNLTRILSPARTLSSSESSSLFSPQKEIDLQELADRTTDDGFIQNYCLNENDAKQLSLIRKKRSFEKINL